MGEKFDNILYSILPLILIVGISWFFSFLGAKARKQTQQAPGQPLPETHTQPEKDPMELFFGIDNDMESPKVSQPNQEQPIPGIPSDTTLGRLLAPEPQITPKPIEPKWWGA
jgi:Na+/H+ antiporter NhaC